MRSRSRSRSSSSSRNSGCSSGGGSGGGSGRNDTILRFTAINGAVPEEFAAQKPSYSPTTDTVYTVTSTPTSFSGDRRPIPLVTLVPVIGAYIYAG